MFAAMLLGTDDNVFAVIAEIGVENLSVTVVYANGELGLMFAIGVRFLRIHIAVPENVRKTPREAEHCDFERFQVQAISRVPWKPVA